MLNEEQEAVKANSILNNKEFSERKIVLESYPRSIFVQLDAPCNQDCLFCSRPDVYRYFSLEDFKNNYGRKLETALKKAERINLTGSGELLLLPEAKKILGYFNGFKYAEKMFATNGSSLTPKMADFILDSQNKYIIHVSMHSDRPDVHEIMTKSKTYDVVKSNLEYLKEAKRKNDNLQLNLIFLATTRNIENLPEFIDFASRFEANAVIVYYNYVYRMDQKEISCCFCREKTNEMLDLAEKMGKERNMKVVLPPRFAKVYPLNSDVCSEAWTQAMINPQGDIITCDVAGDSNESLKDKEFMQVWNGEYYKSVRKNLLDGKYACSKYCFRANPNAVNDFRAHVITRGKSEEEIAKFLEGA